MREEGAHHPDMGKAARCTATERKTNGRPREFWRFRARFDRAIRIAVA
jgi:hypothetical protein